ncbi:Maf family nucleotide pyrophosphatase [soil metagenome]
MNIILGSQSPGRAKVLKEAGYDFSVMHSSIDEKAIRSANFEELPLLIARAKAEALLSLITEQSIPIPTLISHDNSILITADLVVVCDGELREKPTSRREAECFLKSYSNNVARTISAVVVTNTLTGERREGVDIATVYFKEIPNSVIEAMLAKGEVMHGAGALIVEDPLIEAYVERIEGDMDSVIGLPMRLVKEYLSFYGQHLG